MNTSLTVDPSPTQQARRQAVRALLVEAGQPVEASYIATRLGIHDNSARYHLENLANAGQVDRLTGPVQGRGRPKRLYRLRKGWDPDGPRRYQSLAAGLLDYLASGGDPQAQAHAAGAHWGRRQAAQRRPATARQSARRMLIDNFGELGFQPATDGGRSAIRLRHCPFQELTEDPERLVCTVHQGLLDGLLDGTGHGETDATLLPLDEPGTCIVQLRRGAAG